MLESRASKGKVIDEHVKRTLESINKDHRTAHDYLTMSYADLDKITQLSGLLLTHSRYDIHEENMAEIVKAAIKEWIKANDASKLHEDRLIAAIQYEDGAIPRVIYYENERGYHEQLIMLPRISGTTKRKGQIILAVPPKVMIEWNGDPILSNRDGQFSRATYVKKDGVIFSLDSSANATDPISPVYSKSKSYANIATSITQFRDIIENNYHGVRLMFASSSDEIAEVEFAVTLLRIKLLSVAAVTTSLNYLSMIHDVMELKRPVVIGEEIEIDLGDEYTLHSGLPVLHKASTARMNMLSNGIERYLPYFILPKISNVLTSCLSESYVDRLRRVQTGDEITMPLTKYEKELHAEIK